jgi:IclR family transcriptional regulator, pca regulon regulatory protein
MRRTGANTRAAGSNGTSAPAAGDGGRYSRSLCHGLAILTAFSAEHPTRGIADMADELRMSRSTTHRYATTLAELGYLEQNASRRYRLTPRAANFGQSVLGAMALHERSRSFMHELRRQTGWTVSLGILDGTEVMLIDRLRGWRGLHEIDLRLGPSSRLPLHCTAMGKQLLAGLPQSQFRKLLATLSLDKRGPLGRYGPNCIASRRALSAEIERVRAQGFAGDDEELSDGLRSLACPVLDANGATLAAIDLAVPGALFTAAELEREVGAALGQTAERIAVALGE